MKKEKTGTVRRKKGIFKPVDRERSISKALRAYAAHVSSADKGAIRIIED